MIIYFLRIIYNNTSYNLPTINDNSYDILLFKRMQLTDDNNMIIYLTP